MGIRSINLEYPLCSAKKTYNCLILLLKLLLLMATNNHKTVESEAEKIVGRLVRTDQCDCSICENGDFRFSRYCLNNGGHNY